MNPTQELKIISIKFKGSDIATSWGVEDFKILFGMLTLINCTGRDHYFNLDTIESIETETLSDTKWEDLVSKETTK